MQPNRHPRTMARYNRWMNQRLYALCGQLADALRYTSRVNPESRAYPLWLAVVHFFNHQTHQRGQLTTLLSQCGVDPGITDLI